MSKTKNQATLKIMLVEDNIDHALLIRRAIKDLGGEHLVDSASDGQQALDSLESTDQAPDLILLDINMPGLSGFDVLERVRGDRQLQHIPVVMLTSSDANNDIAKAYELGASGYIAKPSHYQDLRGVLQNTLLYWSAMNRHQTGHEQHAVS